MSSSNSSENWEETKSNASSVDSENYGSVAHYGMYQMYIMEKGGKYLYYNGSSLHNVEATSPIQFESIADAATVVPKLFARLNLEEQNAQVSRNNFIASMYEVMEFVVEELSKDKIVNRIEKLSHEFCWILNTNATLFFELKCNSNEFMEYDQIQAVMGKMVIRDMLLYVLFYESNYYIYVDDTQDTEHTLDFESFPAFSNSGPCVLIRSYNDPMLERLILRCAVEDVVSTSLHALSSVQKQNTNVQLCGIWPNLTNHVNVIAVNEKWCYGGAFESLETVELDQIGYILPSIRQQVHLFKYIGEVDMLPEECQRSIDYFQSRLGICYVNSLIQQVHSLLELIKHEILNTEAWIVQLVEKLQVAASWVGSCVTSWLNGDGSSAFFEFQCVEEAALADTKYLSCKVIINDLVMLVMHVHNSYYVTLQQADTQEHEFLMCDFPNVLSKGRGYIVKSYSNGIPQWKSVRQLLLWEITDEYVPPSSGLHDSVSARIAIASKHSSKISDEKHSESVISTNFKQDGPKAQEKGALTSRLKAKIPHHIAPMGSKNVGLPWDNKGKPIL